MPDQMGDAESPDSRSECPECGRSKADQGDCPSNYHNTPVGDSGNPKDDEAE